ncbi:MAG: rsbT co-antagonist protein RsbR [Streptosporangiaceae bacterium]|nr:rsbT co-antagonist protein RsbR [Streptosporangiaceae bacterium]
MTAEAIAATEDFDSSYIQMMDSITDFKVMRLDGEGIVRSWQAGAQELTRYTAEEIVGRPVALFYTAEDIANGLVETDLRATAEAGRHETQGWRVAKDGTQFWAYIVFTAVRDQDGGVRGYVMAVRDLTGRREQEQALRSVEQMVNSITDCEVIQFDPDGMVRSWNPGAEKLTGYAAAEVIGQHMSMFYTADDTRSGLLEREMAGAVRDGSVEAEGWRIRKDGTRYWANFVLSPIREGQGEVKGYVKVGRDLTERREQERLAAQQRDEILELSTPVIKVWDKVLILPLIGTLDSGRAARLTESLLERIAADEAEVVILDISGVPGIDSGVAQHLLETVEAARLMGTESIISGVRPDTAQSMVHLGIELGGLRSRSSLKDALQLALRLVGTRAQSAEGA